jgi:hypothetical protein
MRLETNKHRHQPCHSPIKTFSLKQIDTPVGRSPSPNPLAIAASCELRFPNDVYHHFAFFSPFPQQLNPHSGRHSTIAQTIPMVARALPAGVNAQAFAPILQPSPMGWSSLRAV